MNLSGRPLLDTEPDHQLFAGRDDELRRLVDLVRHGTNTLVIGERGAGKTTLLRQLAFVLRQENASSPAFVEGRLADSPRQFIELTRSRLGMPPVNGDSPFQDTLELPGLVATLRDATSDRRVVLVDEVTPEVGATLFGRLRDEMWQLPLTWVVAVTEDDAAPLQTPPADAFFEAVLRLDPLSWDEQRQVLEARLGSEGAMIAAQIDEGNPRRLLALARSAKATGVSAAQHQAAMIRRQEEIDKLGRPATMLMAELESLGPSSASDERLLERLGWTRSRAVQVLRQLEKEGLVTASFAKGPSGGRRKVYRPVEPFGSEESS